MSNVKEMPISKETQKIIAKKLNSDQLFVLLVLAISSVLVYFMMTKMTSQIDAINYRLDRLIDLNDQNLSVLRAFLDRKEESKEFRK
jgi:hypothetical protein